MDEEITKMNGVNPRCGAVGHPANPIMIKENSMASCRSSQQDYSKRGNDPLAALFHHVFPYSAIISLHRARRGRQMKTMLTSMSYAVSS